jgi:hypothetical protein
MIELSIAEAVMRMIICKKNIRNQQLSFVKLSSLT